MHYSTYVPEKRYLLYVKGGAGLNMFKQQEDISLKKRLEAVLSRKGYSEADLFDF
jgi:hypothetical protein